MRVLVAGGTGAIGRHAVPQLVQAGHEVTVVSRRPDTDSRLEEVGAEPVRLDLFDADAVAVAAKGCDAVVNLATHIPPPPAALRMSAWETNHRLRRDGSRVLATAAIESGARFVQESFAPTYRDGGSTWITEDTPLDPVAQATTVPDAESSAESVSRSGGAGIVLRFGLFYGPHPVARGLLDMAGRRGRLLLPGPGSRYTSMIHLHDAAAAVVAALELPAGTYNVVDDEPLIRSEHAAVLATVAGRSRVKPLPTVMGRLPVLRVLARSHRISNAKLKAASAWQPLYPSVREGWPQVAAHA